MQTFLREDLGVAEVIGHVVKMLQLDNWKLIENHFTRNLSNARKFRITMRYLPRDFALISARIFTNVLQVVFYVFFFKTEG